MNETIRITFITPCFCRGADCSPTGTPEIRPPSIRGQLHWWFRALGGTYEDEKAVFGGVHGEAAASKLVLRVRSPYKPHIESSPTLPHKSGGPASPKLAISPGETFDLLLSTRLGGLDTRLDEAFTRTLNAWLLMGAMGLRATRGGGNFTWEGQPSSPEEYRNAVNTVIRGSALRAALLEKDFPTAESARRDIADTLADRAFGNAAPLGKAMPSRERKTSPLRFRVVRFESRSFRILAVWDGRQTVTGNTMRDLANAIETLATANKPIGRLLRPAAATLTQGPRTQDPGPMIPQPAPGTGVQRPGS